MHIDGAFGLWAQASAKTSHLSRGIEVADSWATDGHKWLQTPYDCGYAIVRNELAHRRAMTIAASYLPLAGEGERDPSHYVPELSRRARGFATWAMLKHLGRDGIAALIDQCCASARLVADLLSQQPGIAILNEVTLNQLVIRFGADLPSEEGDALTRKTIGKIQADGMIFAGGAKWRGRDILRLSVTNFQTTSDEAQLAAQSIIAAFKSVSRG